MKVSHILVKDEKTAKEVKEKVNNGGRFCGFSEAILRGYWFKRTGRGNHWFCSRANGKRI